MNDLPTPKHDEFREHKLAALRAEIQIAVDQDANGRVSKLNKETLREIQLKGRDRLKGLNS